MMKSSAKKPTKRGKIFGGDWDTGTEAILAFELNASREEIRKLQNEVFRLQTTLDNVILAAKGMIPLPHAGSYSH